MPDITIISTGEELLYGTTVNTNSASISNLFFGSNFRIVQHLTVGDDIDSIFSSIHYAMSKSDVIIITGGLGPTDDDNTVEAVCRLFDKKIIIDEESRFKTINYFKSMNFLDNILDLKMSSIPENSHILRNRNGLAPGFILNLLNKVIICLPGVPSEVNDMMLDSVLPYLKEKYSFQNDMKLIYRMSGIRESDINSNVNELNLPDFLKVGITSKSGVCELTLTGFNIDLIQKEKVDFLIKNKLQKFIFDYNAESPEEELVLLLKEKGLTISTAESCTGGMIAKKITDVAGASEVYKGSIVAYSNEIKNVFLGVKSDTLDMYGAVSEFTALEMVSSIKEQFRTDIAVSTTGIAGPGGGSNEKPVGTVCFGFKINDYIHSTTIVINGNRERVRVYSSLYAINFVRNFIKNSFQ